MTTGNAPTIEFKEFSRKQIAELADWCEGFDMTGVSVSDADKLNGSPKTGDKIARNPKNHADRWLVAADYFADNFEPVEKLAALEKPVPVEPDYWNKLGKEHYWENEARRYAGNSDYWRERAEAAESLNRRMVELYRDLVVAAERTCIKRMFDDDHELRQALAKLEEE
ncbi:MAG: hypothetical protein ACO2ZD_08385 [Pseudomonadales bacterium]